MEEEASMITVALPAGRMLEEAARALGLAGYDCPYDKDSRKLIFDGGNVRYLIARPSDVPVYVARGAADVGIVGKDGLSESGEQVYELMDLGFGRCRFVLAAPEDDVPALKKVLDAGGMLAKLRIATKFPSITRDYAAGKVMRPEIIVLKGAVELAPAIGLADAIVDIVESGKTLAENGLAIIEQISESSARLIANRSSYGIKAKPIADLMERMGASGRTGGGIR